MMMAAASVPSARSDWKIHGRWYTDTRPGLWYAYTESGSGSFGLTCDETCSYYVHVHGPCSANRKYDLVVTSELGSITSRATCYPDDDWRYLVFDDNGLETLIGGATIAIRVPNENGPARGAAFLLDGADEAIAAIASQWTPPRKTPMASPPTHSSSAHRLFTEPPPMVVRVPDLPSRSGSPR